MKDEKELIKYKEIGTRIRGIRIRHNISQEKMAEILGIHSTTHYQNIEYGKNKPSYSHLAILYEKFEATPNYIILGKKENKMEYQYDFFSLPWKEQLEIYLEITNTTFKNARFEGSNHIKKYYDNIQEEE